MSAPPPGLHAADAGARLLAPFTAWPDGPGGAALSQFQIAGIHCAACSGIIEAALLKLPGVEAASVNPGAARLVLRWRPALVVLADVLAALQAVGYRATPDAAAPARELRRQEKRQALWRLFAAGFLMMLATPACVAEPGELTADLNRLLRWGNWVLTLPVMVVAAGPFFSGAWRQLRARRLGMDVPVALGHRGDLHGEHRRAFRSHGSAGPRGLFRLAGRRAAHRRRAAVDGWSQRARAARGAARGRPHPHCRGRGLRGGRWRAGGAGLGRPVGAGAAVRGGPSSSTRPTRSARAGWGCSGIGPKGSMPTHPQDFVYLTALLLMSAYALFLFTAVAGRQWCGYACPQTVYTEIFVRIEHGFEGDRDARLRLDKASCSFDKLWRKGGKHAAWIALSLFTGLSFVAYFTPMRELTSFSFSGWEAFWVLFYGFATYGNAGFMREQVCKYMCPYARFQSAMFDRDTLIVSYDAVRGEPR